MLLLALSHAYALDSDSFEPAGSSMDEQGGLQVIRGRHQIAFPIGHGLPDADQLRLVGLALHGRG